MTLVRIVIRIGADIESVSILVHDFCCHFGSIIGLKRFKWNTIYALDNNKHIAWWWESSSLQLRSIRNARRVVRKPTNKLFFFGFELNLQKWNLFAGSGTIRFASIKGSSPLNIHSCPFFLSIIYSPFPSFAALVIQFL